MYYCKRLHALLQGTSKNLETSPSLCFSPLAALNKIGNSDAMSENQHRLTRARFFEVPFSFKCN